MGTMKYSVKYKIVGYEQEFESPSYPLDEIDSHLFDIAGYEGVYNAYIAYVDPTKELND